MYIALFPKCDTVLPPNCRLLLWPCLLRHGYFSLCKILLNLPEHVWNNKWYQISLAQYASPTNRRSSRTSDVIADFTWSALKAFQTLAESSFSHHLQTWTDPSGTVRISLSIYKSSLPQVSLSVTIVIQTAFVRSFQRKIGNLENVPMIVVKAQTMVSLAEYTC